MAYAGRAVVAAGLVVGSGGNLSARIPGSDECWVTGSGVWLDRLGPAAFVRVRIPDGAVVDAKSAAPSSEWALHVAVYRARPDATAVIHLHPQTVVLLDALSLPVRLVTTDHVYYLRQIGWTPFAPPGSTAVADLVADAVRDGTDVVVLANHGCAVLADSVELAHKRALYLEEAARLSYAAVALGRVDGLRPCPPAWVERVATGRAGPI
jgi:ribulose-5-phosphate 4-epimerase/fuculose-1-phosphate aldolase